MLTKSSSSSSRLRCHCRWSCQNGSSRLFVAACHYAFVSYKLVGVASCVWLDGQSLGSSLRFSFCKTTRRLFYSQLEDFTVKLLISDTWNRFTETCVILTSGDGVLPLLFRFLYVLSPQISWSIELLMMIHSMSWIPALALLASSCLVMASKRPSPPTSSGALASPRV